MSFFSNGSCSEDQIKSFCTVPVKCVGVSEPEITYLKEALRAQQQLLRKIYFELDEEREAAATAASEALSMIIRLQGEKATMKMEAVQYKRMAEEKMFHAEISLAGFEDLMYQKEMEIASLEFQIQAYRCKLLSLGCSDSTFNQKRFSDNILMQRNDTLVRDRVVNSVMRGNSLPPIRLDSYYSTIDRERCAVPMADSASEMVEEKRETEFNIQSLDSDNKLENPTVGNINAYPEQIEKLDKLVKVLLKGKHSESEDKSLNSNGGLSSVSLFSQGSSCTSHDLVGDTTDESKYSESLLESEASVKSCDSILSVDDIFEVPQCCHHLSQKQLEEKEQHKLIVRGENRLQKPDSSLHEPASFKRIGEIDCMEKLLSCANCLCKASVGVAIDSHSALTCPLISVAESQADFLQLSSERTKQFEDDKNGSRLEVRSGGEEEVELLRETHEPLNSIESELRSWRPAKSVQLDESSLLLLKEAMLHFWL